MEPPRPAEVSEKSDEMPTAECGATDLARFSAAPYNPPHVSPCVFVFCDNAVRSFPPSATCCPSATSRQGIVGGAIRRIGAGGKMRVIEAKTHSKAESSFVEC